MATVLRETTPEHQARLSRHIVERVVVEDGEVREIEVRLAARPFFDGMAVAPPDGFGGTTQC